MANSTTTMISSMVMIILFSFAIIGFSIGFANDNSAAVRIDTNPNISSLYGSSGNVVETFRDNSNSTESSIIGTKIEQGSDVIKSPTAFTLSWGNLYGVFGTIMTVLSVEIFGNNPAFMIFTTSLVTLIAILFTFYIIKAWRGNP